MNNVIYFTSTCFLVLLVNISGKNFNSENVTLTINQGTLFGKKAIDFKNNTYYSFEEIPYAKSPTGILRFKEPQPAEQWNGILNATTSTRVCPQLSNLENFDAACNDEDCLLLNIYSKMKTKLQPVMVFIHGGGSMWGGMNCIFRLFYGPQFFVQEDVVLVQVQYRLNVFGFLSIDDPKYDIPGNAGFKDQIMALKWIQKNIEDFGGDPNNVTIFGHSAGAAAVHLLYLLPLANGLFHRAIVQSSAVNNQWMTSLNKVFELADMLGCSNKSIDAVIKCINGTKMNHLLSHGLERLRLKNLETHPGNGKVIEFNILTMEKDRSGSFISENPEHIAKKGKFNKVPIIMGFSSHDGYSFIQKNSVKPNFIDSRELIPEDLNVDLNSNKAFKLGKRIREFYYGNSTPSYQNIDPFIDFLTDSMFLQKVYYYAKLQADKYENVYFYQFDYWTTLNSQVDSLNKKKHQKLVLHGDDLNYMFYNSLKNYKQGDPNIAIGVHRMVKLWTTFAKTGNPNVQNDSLLNVTWLPIHKDKFNYLHINPSLELKVNPCEKRMKFWNDVYAEYNSS